jgi:hypothetical protein
MLFCDNPYVELFQKLNQRNSASKIEFQEPAQRRSVQVSAKRAVGKDSNSAFHDNAPVASI